MNTKIIKFDINKRLYDSLLAKQGDTKSRFLLFNLFDGSIPFSLENRNVRVYAIKPDKTEVFNDLIITDAAKGYCVLELTTQMLAVAGTVKLELMVTEGEKKLTSNIFYMDVKESINSEKALVSTNEFGALLTALQDVKNWNKEFTEKSDKLEELYTPKLNKLREQMEHITSEKADINKGVFSSPTLTVVQKMEVLTEATRLCGSEVGRKYIVIQAPDNLDISIAEGWGDVLDDNGAIYETLPAGKETIFTSKSPIWAKATQGTMVLIKKEVNI